MTKVMSIHIGAAGVMEDDMALPKMDAHMARIQNSRDKATHVGWAIETQDYGTDVLPAILRPCGTEASHGTRCKS